MSNPTNIPETVTINPDNKYHIHRKEIYELWEEHKKAGEPCDLSTACAEYRDKMGWGDPDPVKDGIDEYITEFCRYVESIPGKETTAYFIG